MTLYVKCRECGSEFRSDIQMNPETFQRPDTVLDNKSEDCPFCGKTNTYSKSDYIFKD
ncbi:MAG: hypothetical protein ACE5KU_05990 [Nitrososphaerales archaeon]